MTKPENVLRSKLIQVLSKYDACPVENGVMNPGTPDINTTFGWIECKRLMEYPKKCETEPIKLKHPILFTQKVWIKQRIYKKGIVLVIVQIKNDYYVFEGDVACHYLDNMNKGQMIDRSEFFMENGFSVKGFLLWMKDYLNRKKEIVSL